MPQPFLAGCAYWAGPGKSCTTSVLKKTWNNQEAGTPTSLTDLVNKCSQICLTAGYPLPHIIDMYWQPANNANTVSCYCQTGERACGLPKGQHL